MHHVEIMNEEINRSAQLTPGQIKAYIEPKDKDGNPLATAMSGRTECKDGIIHLLPEDPLDQCVKRGIIEEWHRQTGRWMRDINERANSKVNGIRFPGGGSDAGAIVDAETLNKHIKLAMTLKNWQRISILVFPKRDIDGRFVFSEADYKFLLGIAPDMQSAFEALDTAIHEAHKAIKEKIENEQKKDNRDAK